MQTIAAGSAMLVNMAHAETKEERHIASSALRILILGGTGFIGPHFVRAAVERGHQVSVFNRGKSRADLPREVNRLYGDRSSNLSSIKGNEWDAVIDLATYVPQWVRTLGETLGQRVRHYTLVSSIGVYESPGRNVETHEGSPLVRYQGNLDPYLLSQPGDQYGPLKALCEREAEKQFPGRTLIIRPGCIFGPGGAPNDFFTYWPARTDKGGEVLVASDPWMPIQYIDVRDLAEWSVRMIERSATEIYNVIGPAVSTSFAQFIHTSVSFSSARSTPTWVSPSWLAARPNREMAGQLLFWSFEAEGFANYLRMSNRRALANGLTARPISSTLADTFDWFKRQSMGRQAELLSMRQGTRVPMTWPAYLEYEQATLTAWHEERLRPSDNWCDVRRP